MDPCLLHGDKDCEVCYPVKRQRARARPTPKPRVALSSATKMHVEERVNFKVLAPILHEDELKRHPELINQPLTDEELEYLIRRSDA